MGRPSRLIADIEDGRVRVGGEVVVLVTGTLGCPSGRSASTATSSRGAAPSPPPPPAGRSTVAAGGAPAAPRAAAASSSGAQTCSGAPASVSPSV